MLNRSVLFVCTGNTCRSAMAAAITQHVCTQHGIELKIQSAGIAASLNKPITAVAGEVLLSRGVVVEHKSQLLSRKLLLESDRVFVMEKKHHDAANSLLEETDTTWCPKIEFLDQPNEISDPLGKSREIYEDLAFLLFDLIYKNVLRGENDSRLAPNDGSQLRFVDKK